MSLSIAARPSPRSCTSPMTTRMKGDEGSSLAQSERVPAVLEVVTTSATRSDRVRVTSVISSVFAREVRAAVERIDAIGVAEADPLQELLDAARLRADFADDVLRRAAARATRRRRPRGRGP